MNSLNQIKRKPQESNMAADEELGELTLSELIASASILQCSQCGEVFRDPMLLPCLHSFCLECLVDLLLQVGGQQRNKNGEPVKVNENRNREGERFSPAIQGPQSQRTEHSLDGGSVPVEKASGSGTDECTSTNKRTRSRSAKDKRESSSRHSSEYDERESSTGEDTAAICKSKRGATNVGVILREIEGRRADPGEIGSTRPRRLRPLSAKPGGSTNPSLARSVSPLSGASIDSTSTTAWSACDGNISTCSQLLRQNKSSRLCLVCPTCGRMVQLKADILLQDDDDDGNVDGGNDAYSTYQDGSHAKDLEIRQTIESSEENHSLDTGNKIPHEEKTTNITKPAAMTTMKLRVLLRKTIASSLLPNHFLKSLATIYRHKNPARENISNTRSENGPECTGSRKGGQIPCAYCLSEGQNVEACSLCLDCNDQMCEACASAHRKTRVTRNHTVAPLNSIRQGLFDHDLRAQDHVMCPQHQGVAVSCFCCDCLSAVCKRCKAEQHRAHKITSLRDISVKLIPELNQIQRAIGRRVPGLASYHVFLQEQVTKLENKKQLVEREITEQAQRIHRMIDEHKQKLLSQLEEACTEHTSYISVKIRETARDKESLAKTSAFLLHLGRLGRADEIVTSYSSIVHFYRLLINSNGISSDPEEREDGSSASRGQSEENARSCSNDGDLNGASTPDVPVGMGTSSSSSALTSRLACVFTTGPCTDTNMGILLGELDLSKVPLHAQDSPQCKLPLTSLMPERLHCPRIRSIFHTGIDGDRCPVYPSGLALHPRLLALVDRENAAVKLFDKSNGKFLRSIKGEASSSLVKPFDVVFLDKTGTTLAVSDSEAGVVRVFESMTGKFVRNFAGDVRHPRGLAVVPDTGQVVVVDGHLRHLTFHDPATGQMVRRLRPTLKSNDNSRFNCTDVNGGSRGGNDLDNDSDNTDSNRRRYMNAKEHHKPSKENIQKLSTVTTSEASVNLKSTALIDPYYVALTLSGDFAVTDQASPNLKVVSKHTGDILSQNMDYGTGQEESLHPSGLCVDHYGQIFISDTNNNRVHLALPNGHLTGTVLLQDKRKTELARTALAEGMRAELSNESAEKAVDKPGCFKEADPDSDACDISVSKPLCLAIDEDTGHLVVAMAGGQVKVVQYM